MNQVKIGETLRTLRKEKGLTQEQLAEKFNTTNRSVSRWETGSSLPDISLLIEIADFYNVELKDILAGEIKENMDTNVKETAMLVADYTNESKEKLKKSVHFLCMISTIALIGSLVIQYLKLDNNFWDFMEGLGIGLSLGSLVISVIYTSKNVDKLLAGKKGK